VNKPLPDSWQRDQHLSLKRWERGAQRAAWKTRGAEFTAPPLPCFWRATVQDTPEFRQAHILALFSGDLALVRFAGGVPGDSGGLRVLRGGIPWERWSPVILEAWRNAGPVPEPFRLRRRLPPDWLDKALAWNPADQKAFLDKLREGGTLPPLQPIHAEAVAPWLRWDEMRGRLMDFKTEI
jgi:hypothetical protein